MTRSERRSLIILFSLAVLGHLIRALLATPGSAPGAVTLFDPATDGDPLAQQQRVEELMRPLGAAERIDIEQATVAELQRLPGVGPAMAARIVADRQSQGAFGGMAGLDRVPGIGTATAARLAPHLQFNGVPADISMAPGEATLVELNQATAAQLDALPGIGAARARAIVAFRDSSGPFRQISELLRVPGLSRALVEKLSPRLVVR